MKHLLLALSFLISSHAFAGAYHTSCTSKDKSLLIVDNHIGFSEQDMQRDYDKLASFFLDTNDSANPINGDDIASFLQDKGEKYAVVRESFFDNKDHPLKVISVKSFRDECGNKGEARRFKAFFSVLDKDGKQVKAPTELLCEFRGIPGHCI